MIFFFFVCAFFFLNFFLSFFFIIIIIIIIIILEFHSKFTGASGTQCAVFLQPVLSFLVEKKN